MTSTKLFVINWFNHYNDEHLIEDYDNLEKLLAEHDDKVEILYDSDNFAVIEYETTIEKVVQGFKNGLFEPEYHDSLEDWISDYYEYDSNRPDQITSLQFFEELDYQAELGDIMKRSGGNEKEFDRLWCERFALA